MNDYAPLNTRRISMWLVNQKCGLALRYAAEGAPEGPPSIALLMGKAIHAGIEHQLGYGDPEQAAELAERELAFLVEREGSLQYDDPPRLTRAGQPYKGDGCKVTSEDGARSMVRLMTEGWCRRFPEIRSRQLEERISIENFLGDWTLIAKLDVQTEEGGIIDIKTTKEPWDLTGKQIGQRDQALLYLYAKALRDGGDVPDFAYHVIPRNATYGDLIEYEQPDDGTAAPPPELGFYGYDAAAIQVLPVEYDPAEVKTLIEYRVRPTVEAMEKGVYRPNTEGYWCSEAFCSYWDICPLGRARYRSRAA